MAIETATYISGLDVTKPGATDSKSEGDNHLRLIKSCLLNTWPNVTSAVTMTHTQLNSIPTLATLASPALTGTPTVPTAAVSTNTTQAASTAYVMSAVTAVNAATTSTTLSISNAASVSLAAGQHDVSIYSGVCTWTLPATPTAGQLVMVTPGNGLTTNIVDRNGSNIMSLAENLTVDDSNATASLRYVNSTIGWRLV